ncbi:hypothetical protein Q8F55_004633 [Vanrija albida]|uniref:DASH complex subunit DAD4 n=1 Tax=Vanrija albida TaxID=181172 RepID=A0ABR3Q7I5_9TREE
MQAMENPHEIEQAILLERIIGNVVKCNEAVAEMNLCIKDFIESSTSVLIAAKMVDNYNENAAYYLGKVDKLPEPV